jgi:hypothetical protein
MALVRTDALEEPILVTLMMEAPRLPNRWLLHPPHGVTTQMTKFFIVTAVKTSNLTEH